MITQEVPQKRIGWTVAAAAAVVAIFLVDVFVPLGISVPVLYVLPILFTWLAPGWRITAMVVGCTLIMTLAGMVVSPGELTSAVGADRALASSLLLLIAALVVRQKILVQQSADVTRALRQREEQLRLAMEGADLGSWDVDVRTGQAVWNRRHALLQGYDPPSGPVSMQDWKDRVHPDDLDRVMACIEQVKADRELFSVDYRVVLGEGGDARWISLHGRFSYDETGEPVRFSGVSLDITERKRAEEVLQQVNTLLEQRIQERTAELVQANERFHLVAKATNDGMWDWDLDHDRVYFSPRWKEMHGFQDSDQLESLREWSAHIHPEDRQRVLKNVEGYLQHTQSQFWEEYRIQRKDGSYFWVLDRGIAIWDGQGRAVRIVGAQTDITWRKEAEEALRRKQHEFHMLADNVPALFAYIDRDRYYRFVNKQYEELFGRSDEEIVGMAIWELLGAEGYKTVRSSIDLALEGRPVSFEYRLSASGTGERWLAAHYMPDQDEQGRIMGLFVLQTDITAQKAAEQQLRELSGRLLTVQEDERRRIARDLHDDVMQRIGALTLELYGLASSTSLQDTSIASQLNTCGALAEQLTTDLQRIAHDLHPSILEHVGLEAAVRGLVDEFAVRTGITAEFVAQEVPRPIFLDRATCLYRVLQEGLQNVQKHAQASTVLVRLLRTGRGLGLCLHDDGCGMAPVDGTTRRKGLGFTSMAERVGMLEGTFRIRSQVGKGTELHAWVPLDVDGHDA